MDNKRIEMLDDYLAGKLNADQAAELEGLASSDKSFKQRLVNQQEVVEGITAFRKAQLKARLDNVVIAEAGSWGTKVAVAVSAVVVIAAGTWVLKGEDQVISQVEVKVPVKVERLMPIVEVESVEEQAVAEKSTEVLAPANVEPVNVTPVTTITSLNLPTVVSNENELLIDEDVDKNATSDSSPLDISGSRTKIVAESVSGRFHYKYKNGNVLVQIAGYSGSNQATLIEYADKQQVYMEYQNVYYELSQIASWTSIEKNVITDRNVIAELKARLK